MRKILHISDLHFGSPYVPEVGEALQKIAPTLEPEAIVVSGDLSQRAKRHEFEEARRFLERLPDVPMMVIPGNHDIPLWRVAERLLTPHKMYREVISEDMNPILRLDGVVLVVRAAHTVDQEVARVTELIGRKRLLGVVLNDARTVA